MKDAFAPEPAKKRKRNPLESSIERRCCQYAEERGWLQRKFKSPGRRSAQDRIFAKNGHVFFVEFKRLGGVLAEKQALEHKEWAEHGIRTHVCYGFEQFCEQLVFEERYADSR